MRRRRSFWGRRPWRERKYAANTDLHAWEDLIVLRAMVEEHDGHGDPHEWASREPARWRLKPLKATFMRLASQGRVKFEGRSVTRVGWKVYVHLRYKLAAPQPTEVRSD